MEGTRKFWLAAIGIGVLLLGLVTAFLFKSLTASMWTAWCTAVGGVAGGYLVSNVVSKTIDGAKGKRK